jgi:hypothetical protein
MNHGPVSKRAFYLGFQAKREDPAIFVPPMADKQKIVNSKYP